MLIPNQFQNSQLDKINNLVIHNNYPVPATHIDSKSISLLWQVDIRSLELQIYKNDVEWFYQNGEFVEEENNTKISNLFYKRLEEFREII